MRSFASWAVVRALAAAVLCLAASAAVAQTPFSTDTVIVSRGEAHLTFQDIDDYLQNVPADKRAGMMDSPKRIEALLLSLLLDRQLALQAERLKLDSAPELQGKSGWQRTQALAKLRIDQYMKDLKVPDMELLAHEEYLGHKSKYVTPGARTVQRIVVTPANPGDKDSEKQAWDRAVEARAKALAAPESFGQLVAEYSSDKAGQGLIEDAVHTSPDKRLVEAARTMQTPGEISEVLPSTNGYQVVKLVSVTPDVVRPFAEVHDAILAALKTEYIDSQRRNFLDTLAGEKMDASPEAVAALRIRYASVGMGAAPATAGQPEKH